MSKTLVSVLEVAAIVAIQVFPGIGQAVGAALGSTAFGATFAAVAGLSTQALGTIAATIAVAATSAVINTVFFAPPKPASAESSVKTSNPPRVQSLGRRRLYGAYIFYDTDPNSGCGFDVYAYHDCPVGPIDGGEAIFLGDKRVSNSTQGTIQQFVDGTYSQGAVGVFYQLGARIGTAFSLMVDYFPGLWTTSHRGDGVVTGMVKWNPVKSADYNTVYPNGQPQMSLVARWLKVYDWRDSSQSLTDPTTWKWSESAVLGYVFYKLINEGERPTVPSVIAGANNPAWDAQLAAILTRKWAQYFAPTLDLWTAAANDADSAIPITSFRSLVVNNPAHGTGHMELALVDGLAPDMIISLTAGQDLDETEILTVTSVSGNVVYFTPDLAYDHDGNSVATWTSTSDHPLTEARYRTCATWNMTSPHKDNLSTIRNCFDGWVSAREDGALVCYSGSYYTPTVTVGPDTIVSYSLDNGIEDENAVNEIVLTSVSPEHNYATPECEAWRDEDDIEARGRVASQTLENHVPSYTQARRLAKRYMARAMAEYRGTITTNQLGRVADGQRFIHLTITEGGVTWFDGPVEITKLTHIQTGLTFEFVSADPNVDDWDPATEEGQPAPVARSAAITSLDTPTITAATANFGSDSAAGTSGVYIDITAAGLDRDDVTWHARTRITGNTSWDSAAYPDIDSGASVEIQTSFVATDTTVEVQVAYEVGDGRVSDWSETTTVNTSSAHIAPARVTGLDAAGAVGKATVDWNNPTSSNLASENVYASTSSTFPGGTPAASFTDTAGTASSHDITLTAGTWKIWVTTVSTGGTEGSPVGPVTATVT